MRGSVCPASGSGWVRNNLACRARFARMTFLRLCENQHPATGETLTQRLNTVRTENGKEAVNRRVFYDFTFSPPKSVSVAALAGADERIIEAHTNAVRSALREFEAFATTRVRVGGGN